MNMLVIMTSLFSPKKPSMAVAIRLENAIGKSLGCSVSIEDNFLHSEREAVMYRYLLSEKDLWDIYYMGAPARHRKPVASYKIVKRA